MLYDTLMIISCQNDSIVYILYVIM